MATLVRADQLQNPYKFRVYRNAAWTSANASLGLVACDTANFDTGSNVDIVTNKGRFTAPVAGFYHFDGVASASVTLTSSYIAALFKNGSEVSRGQQAVAGASTANEAAVVSDTLQLAANDYVELYYQGTGGAGATGSTITHFSGFLVSST